jgi:hypothetical protein
MSGAAREHFPSEKKLSMIWALLPHLQVCTWYPLIDDAIEYAEQMKKHLDEMIVELKKEKETRKRS